MANDHYIQDEPDRDMEDCMAARYQDALMALTDAALCGCKLETLQTMKSGFGLDKRDFDAIVDFVLKNKFANSGSK